ncbi:MAG: hypothetical protein WBN65_05170 [Gammaproteobacteria bacterium]
MQPRNPFLIDGRPAGPVARFLTAVVAVVVLAVSILFGFIFFLSALAAAAIVGIVLWIVSRRRPTVRMPPSSGNTLEGDFEVLDPGQSKQERPKQ